MAATVQKVSVALGREPEADETEARRARQDRAWNDFLSWATGDRPLSEDELDAARAELAND